MKALRSSTKIKVSRGVFRNRLRDAIPLYIMLIFPIAYFLIFCYGPMAGLVIAFKKYSLWRGIWASPWSDPVFKNFEFIKDDYFWGTVRNTLAIGTTNLVVNFSIPIILALLINELRPSKYKKLTQTITYLPYFVSTVALVGIIMAFLSPSEGIVNNLIKSFGGSAVNFMTERAYFIPIYIVLVMWQTSGWSTIIYLAAMTNVNPELYEAASIEGAGRLKKMWHITLPAIKPTIMILFIMAVPGIIGADFEKVLLLQTPQTLKVSDVVATYTYRRGLTQMDFSFGTAMGLFYSIIGILIILIANKISKKVAEISIW